MGEDCIMHEEKHWEGLQQGTTCVITGEKLHTKMKDEDFVLNEIDQLYHQCKNGPTK